MALESILPPDVGVSWVVGGNGQDAFSRSIIQKNGDTRNFRQYYDRFDPDNPRECFVQNSSSPDPIRTFLQAENDYTLTYDQWKDLDKTLIKVRRDRLGVVTDLMNAGLVYQLPGGISKTIMSWQTVSDPHEARVSMNGLAPVKGDRPVVDYNVIPVPIIHSEFSYTWREIAEAAQSNMPLDTTSFEAATRRVWETIEKLTTGTYGTYTAGGGTLYGMTNWTSRLTGSLDDPTGGTWTPKKLLQNLMAMRQALYGQKAFGPYMLYNGLGWDQYLGLDYSDTKGDNTVRKRILDTDAGNGGTGRFIGMKTLDYLPSMAIVMLQMDQQNMRMVEAMPVQAMRWTTNGGWEHNFRVAGSIFPQIRKTYTGQVAIAHYTV